MTTERSNEALKRELIPLDKLSASNGPQRPFDERKLTNMSGDLFDAEAIGTPLASAHADGTYHLLDGQHRVEALRRAGYTEWECDVYHNLSTAREAELFAKYNDNRTNLSPLTRHHAWRVVGEAGGTQPQAVMAHEITQAVEARGFTIPKSIVPTPESIGAIDALQTTWKIGGKELVEETVSLIKDAWGDTPSRVKAGRTAHMIRALAHFVAYHREHGGYEREHLVEVLREQGPLHIGSLARDISERNPRERGFRPYYLALVGEYNKGRRGAATLKRQYRSLTAPSGSKNFNNKLSDEQVEEVAQLILDGVSPGEIAERYKVADSTVHRVAVLERYSKTMDQARYGKP